MRIGLLGAVESTRVALDVLVRRGASPVWVGSLPLDRCKRHSDFVDIGAIARVYGLPWEPIVKINDPVSVRSLAEADLDLLLIIGWSQLVGPDVRAVAPAVLGFHPSLLPVNRGRGVIPWTILQDQRRAGATLFFIDEGMDTGDIAFQMPIAVDESETARTLYDKVLRALSELLGELIETVPRAIPRAPQDHRLATVCGQRLPEDGRVDWTLPAREIWRLVRASGRPYPGAFTTIRGTLVRLWAASLTELGSRYWAVPGQVITISDGAMVVMCGERSAICVDEYEFEGDGSGMGAAPRIVPLHTRLGRTEGR